MRSLLIVDDNWITILSLLIIIGILVFISFRNHRKDVDRINRKLAKERLKRIKKCRKKQ